MPFFQRAARLAALVLTTAGLLATSAPGIASELSAGTSPASLSATLNPPATPLVPLPAAIVPTDIQVAAPKASFASLADAVAAQDGAIEDEHIRCLASAIYFESQGEPLMGQLAVARVIINRTQSGRFASDVCGVVKQRGQFSFVRGGSIPSVDISLPNFRRAIAVAKVAMADMWEAPAGDALYFNGARSSHSGSKRVALIGNHAFYR